MAPDLSPDPAGRALPREMMRRLPLFADLSDADLDDLLEMSVVRRVPAGEVIIREGGPGGELYLVIEGELEVSKRQGDRDRFLAIREAGEVVGEMSLLEQEPRSASVRTVRESRLLVIGQAAFRTLLRSSESATLTILKTVVSRLRSMESMLMQQEKLAALGTVAAGLAHELNNPASALVRSTSLLGSSLDAWGSTVAAIGRLALEPDQISRLTELRGEVQRRSAEASSLSSRLRSEREEELERWLEERAVGSSWEVAPVLVASGWEPATLEERLRSFAPPHLPAIVAWLAGVAEVYNLIREARMSAGAISEIVGAVKNYAYLDRAPIGSVDVHESLENTLVILRHKARGGITIVRDYAPDLPRIEAFGSELSGVWTNLIDNAIDALKGTGVLRLRTYRRDDEVVVEVRDNGPGIPPEIQSRIFEPFFTTKPVGSGTGLGLHLAYDTVVHRHGGQIHVRSRPGETCFQVILPLRVPSR